jgi:hypothetical protein
MVDEVRGRVRNSCLLSNERRQKMAERCLGIDVILSGPHMMLCLNRAVGGQLLLLQAQTGNLSSRVDLD